MQKDVVIIGAGAAGLMCAIEAGRRGRKVLLIDHHAKAGEKIRISGGGRCNFTNLHIKPQNFISNNPYFCVSALSRYTPHDFIDLLKKHGIAFHEKAHGQLFCDGSARQIVSMLVQECQNFGVDLKLKTLILKINKTQTGFDIETSMGLFHCTSLVVACGGLSIPQMGATGLGYDIADQFGLKIVATRPALVPFTLFEKELNWLSLLSGIAVEAIVKTDKQVFREGLLFTHRGLSGPVILQSSSYWQEGVKVIVNFAPDFCFADLILEAKKNHPKRELISVFAPFLPKRLIVAFLEYYAKEDLSKHLADITDKRLLLIASYFDSWEIIPLGTEGYRTAEVTKGGVDTDELSSKTMESKKVSGLYFIGEVVDVTGHLGGFNFGWAWSSGFVAGQYV